MVAEEIVTKRKNQCGLEIQTTCLIVGLFKISRLLDFKLICFVRIFWSPQKSLIETRPGTRLVGVPKHRVQNTMLTDSLISAETALAKRKVWKK